jgi:hypothetical protein
MQNGRFLVELTHFLRFVTQRVRGRGHLYEFPLILACSGLFKACRHVAAPFQS